MRNSYKITWIGITEPVSCAFVSADQPSNQDLAGNGLESCARIGFRRVLRTGKN